MPVRGVSDRTFLLLDTTTGTRVPAAVSYNPSTWRATLVPAALLVAGRTYRLEASGRILNADGRALLPVRWTFKVTTDGTPPSFSRSPSAGATGVSRATNVVLQFSEPVGGVDGTTVRLRDDVTKAWITASVTYDAALRRATLDPAPTLIGLRTYQVVVGIGIKDAAGNPLAPVSWRFTTRS